MRTIIVLFSILLLLSMGSCKKHPPEITNFAVSPSSVTEGAKAELCYELINAASARIEPTVGELTDRNKSCLNVEPRQTTTYTLSATSTDGQTITRQVTLNVEAPPPVASITRFEAKREESTGAAPGSPAELCYEVSGASSLRIEPEIGEVEPLDKGCRTVKPAQTTTYKLTASGSDNRPVSQEATVNIVHPPARIIRYDLSPVAVKAGDSVRLCYHIEDATRANIENLNYTVKIGQNECVTFQPRRTNTYRLEARNQDGRLESRQVRVTVEQPPAEITDFSARSAEVEKGSDIVLHYKVSKAAKARIAYAGGAENLQKAEGDFTHRPVRTTTYTLTAENLDGEAISRSVDVKVIPPSQARILGFSARPQVITLGQEDVKLCYGVTMGSRAELYSEVQKVSRELESSENKCITVRPTATDTYTLTATGPNGRPVTAEAKVTVKEAPRPAPSADIAARAEKQSGKKVSIGRGDMVQLCYRLTNVAQARITPVFDNVEIGSGWRCLNLPPQQETTTFTLNAKGLDGTTLTRQALVEVYPAPEILFFRARNDNGRFSLCYKFRFEARAQITPQIGDLRNSEGCVALPANPAPSYTLTVWGRGQVPPAVATYPPR
jgi:hypothetical protein